MAISKFLKLRVVLHNSVKEEIVASLQRLGVIEFVNLPATLGDKVQEMGMLLYDSRNVAEVESQLNDFRFALDYLETFKVEKRGLMDKLFVEKVYLSEEELEREVRELDYRSIVSDIREKERKINEIRNRRTQLSSERELLESWKDLGISLEFFEKGTQETEGIMGSLKAEEFEKFHTDVESKLSLWEFRMLPSKPDEKAFALIYMKNDAPVVREIIKDYNFTAFTVPKRKGTPVEALKEIEEEFETLEHQEGELEEKLRSYLPLMPKLKLAYDYLSVVLDRMRANTNFVATGKATVFEGWVQQKDSPKVKVLLDKYSGLVAYRFDEPEPDDVVPSVIENRPLIQPFEVLTTLYGLPVYGKDIDPTPHMAPFFFVFFGLCLTDAGYGLVIALLMGYLLFKYGNKFPPAAKKFFTLLFYSGISTIIFGGIESAWFGDLFFNISWLRPLGNLSLKFQLLDPMKDPITVLMLSLALGVVHIFYGLILKAYVNIKQGRVKDAIFDQVGWLWFLSSLMLLGGVKTGKLPSSLLNFSYVMVAIGAGILVTTQGREEKNIIKRALKGIMSLYDVMSYLSDVLSYSRLLALGMGTTVIAMIVNMLAVMVGRTPYIGVILMVIMLVFGHTFSILVNALGAFIHSTRLQYVEFFSKFYEGGAKAFEPFSVNTKYTRIAD
ncbi:MAG: V-type ATP synthase subunit I [Synergistetes bacterium]|nr:V-type ATP synthase subunit I [Synergistota bacterium]